MPNLWQETVSSPNWQKGRSDSSGARYQGAGFREEKVKGIRAKGEE